MEEQGGGGSSITAATESARKEKPPLRLAADDTKPLLRDPVRSSLPNSPGSPNSLSNSFVAVVASIDRRVIRGGRAEVRSRGGLISHTFSFLLPFWSDPEVGSH